MNLTLHVWRQKSRDAAGQFATYKADNISPDASFSDIKPYLKDIKGIKIDGPSISVEFK